MIVVSDTSPLNYLILVDCDDVLPRLFAEVLAPPSVLNELQHPSAPDRVRNWANGPPEWLQVQSPQPFAPLPGLHLGENDAIALALEVRAVKLLVDERAATRIATGLGLDIVSTLAVLEAAAEKAMIDLETTFARLRQTTFRGPSELMDAMIEEDRKRRSQQSP